jgi:hypothetical protein
MRHLSSVPLFVSCLMLFVAGAGRAQIATTSSSRAPGPTSPSIDRKIEVLIRSRFSVPPDYDVLLGAKTGSDIAGYDNLPVTFAHKDKQTVVNFPISKDGSTLARVEKFSIDDNPALAIDVDKRPVRGAPTVRSSPS